MKTALPHDPVLHDEAHGHARQCSYSGPTREDPCPTDADYHVLFLVNEDVGTPTQSLRTCSDHVGRAVEVAVQEGVRMWVHDFADACVDGDGQQYVGRACKPLGRCVSCGHDRREHGRDGCAADDEAAMGGCHCLTPGADVAVRLPLGGDA